MPTNIPLPFLRDMTEAIYDRLPALLKLVDRRGLTVLRRKPVSPEYAAFRASLAGAAGSGADPGNVLSSLRTLGLIDAKGLTPLGKEVAAKTRTSQLPAVKATLGKRMLLDQGGWAFCHVLEIAGGQPREELWQLYSELYNPDMAEHLEDLTEFNKFLAWVGVTRRDFSLNRTAFDTITRVRLDDLRGLSKLSSDARLCLRALITLDPSSFHSGKEIQRQAELLVGRAPNVHQMRNLVTELRAAGLIEYRYRTGSTTTATVMTPTVAGASATVPPGATTPTPTASNRGRHGEWKLAAGAVAAQLTRDFALEYLAWEPDWDLAEIVSTSFATLRNRLSTGTEASQGKALELIAGKLCWRMGLRKVRVARPDEEVAGIEVDVTADRLQPNYQRFLIQCKKWAHKVGPPIIAKELGTASVRKIENLVFLATGGFTPNARSFARQAIQETGRNIYLLDDVDVDLICDSDANLFEVLRRENARCRAIRQGNPEEWLPFEIQWLVPPVIKADSLTEHDAQAAWAKVHDEANLHPRLFPLFKRLYETHFNELEAELSFQPVLGL